MSLKNSAQHFGSSVRSTHFVFTRWPMHSLRTRLMLWYGSLLAPGLACFALLVLFLDSSALNLFLTGAIILILFRACGWAVVGYALRPLSDLVRAASSIATATSHGKPLSELSQRVKRPESHDEMAQVVDAFNEMLASIEGSTTVQRRFIADASHELRAPLTTIQGNLAFLIRYMEEIPPAERRTMLADAHGETLRLASLVDELLLLARADANMGQQPINPTPPAPIVELDRTLLKLVRQVRRRLDIEGLDLNIEIGTIE